MMNIPNALALFRIALAPVVFFLLVERDNSLFLGWHSSWFSYFAGLLFVIAGITDFFDGFIARRWNQMTKLGAILDPLADKMLTLAGFLGLMVLNIFSPWAVLIILTREFFITGLRVAAVAEGKDVSASIAGKIKTFLQLFAIGFGIMNWPYADILLWSAVVLTLYSGWEYVRDYARG